MGFWQNTKDYMWISECEIWITEYAPQHTTTAKAFCEQYRDYALGVREIGKSPHEALIDMCALVLTAVAEGKADTDPIVAQHMMVAYQTGFGFLNRWPNIKIGDDYAIRMFRVMARIDHNIWQSPLASSMSAILEQDTKTYS